MDGNTDSGSAAAVCNHKSCQRNFAIFSQYLEKMLVGTVLNGPLNLLSPSEIVALWSKCIIS